MPQSFKDKYPKTRVIIDGTEIKCQTPTSLVLHSETYSLYKSHTTFKGLIGIAPSRHITFISQFHASSISDRELTVRSGLLNLPFSQGDVVMADKEFAISDLCEPTDVGLNIPPFRAQHLPYNHGWWNLTAMTPWANSRGNSSTDLAEHTWWQRGHVVR